MKYTKELLTTEKILAEDLGVYFETMEGMSPLSARIFSFLLLVGEQGVSFEELTEKLCASKSSISTNLQLLQTSGIISYLTKPGDRKRYFKIGEDQIINRIDNKIENWKKEKQLHSKVLNYRKELIKLNLDDSSIVKGMALNTLYIDLIEAMISNLNRLKSQISLTKNSNDK